MSDEAKDESLGQVIRIDAGRIRDYLGEMVRGTVEEALNAMLDAEADRLCRAARYERTEGRTDTRAGAYEQATLDRPIGRESADSPKSSCGQFDRLTACEDGLDDVGGEECELKAAPDVAGVDTIPGCDLVDGSDRSGGQFLKPAMASRDMGDQPGIDAGLGFVLPTHHQLRLQASPLQSDGYRVLENLFRRAESVGRRARDQADEFRPIDFYAYGFWTQCDAVEETMKNFPILQISMKGREVGDGRAYPFDWNASPL